MTDQFRNISLIGRYQDPSVLEAMVRVADHLLSQQRRVLMDRKIEPAPTACTRVDEAQLTSDCDLLISIGGDGTLLRAASLLTNHRIPLLGINRGRLGFLADIAAEEMLDRIDAVLAGRFETDERTRLDAQFEDEHGLAHSFTVLNEIAIQKHDTGRMLDFETRIDGKYVNTHGGDGLVIATPTGSTGYALSCGGPILTPNLDALVLAPITPHTLSDRPIVVHGSATVEVKLKAQAPMMAAVTGDGVMRGLITKDKVLAIKPSRSSVTLLHPHGYDHFGILRSKLHWGRGHRLMGSDDA